MRYLFSALVFIGFFTACVKDKPETIIQPSVNVSSGNKVYIINEGNFGSGNSSISLFDLENNVVSDNFYFMQNNSALGDVAQSMCRINNQYYIVVNNSGKIVICDDQLKYKTKITGFNSPRYILKVSNQKAYVSDLYANSISIVNLNSNSISGNISCTGWTEQMVQFYNKVFVTNLRKNYVYVVNAMNDKIEDSVLVGKNAGSLVMDKNDKIWVLSSGDNTNNIAGKLCRINPVNNQIEFSTDFALGQNPGSLCINGTKDTLYFLNSHIFRMAVTDAVLPVSAFVAKGNKNFYGLNVHPTRFEVYAADALDYIQKSNIYTYNSNGSEIRNFKAGINASGFLFE